MKPNETASLPGGGASRPVAPLDDNDSAGGGLAGYVFAVGDRPYCCWEWDLPERNLQFLESLDTKYYGYIAGLCIAELETDSGMSASIVLRGAYHQGVETLISLLGAYVQAPGAVPAWLARAQTSDLEDVAQSLLNGRPLLTRSGRHSVTLRMLANDILRFSWPENDGEDSTSSRFASFWAHLCRDLLDPIQRAEYNAIKHGLRVGPGGFTLAVGVEETPGVPATEMRSVGGATHGTTFLQSEKVGESSHHMRVRRVSLNWSARTMAHRLSLISMSINNVIGSLRCDLGVDPTTVRFLRPDSPEGFDVARGEPQGVRSVDMDKVVRISPVDEWPKERLIEELERRGNAGEDAE